MVDLRVDRLGSRKATCKAVEWVEMKDDHLVEMLVG